MTLFLSRGGCQCTFWAPIPSLRRLRGPPWAALFETCISIFEARSHRGPLLGAPPGRQGRVGGPGAPTNTEK